MENKNIDLETFDKKKSNLREIFDWVKTLTLAFLIATFITKVLIINTIVPSESMQTTININDRLITNRLAYLFKEPQRGDVVVIKSPNDEDVLFVKRIIGLPNDTVDIVDGIVYINDIMLEEEYVSSQIIDETKDSTYKVPNDCVFVMGDNREVSIDARYWHNKYVKTDDILGKVVFRYYPGIKFIS